MGTIKNGTKTLFFVTSPRTPNKMIPEIILLQDLLGGKPWNENKTNQKLFMEELCKSPFFESKEVPKNPDLSARDRINRAPKALGFVNLDPVVGITDAGERFVSEKRTEETILKQLLKFQLPSPYHRAPKSDVVFNVKPYLEILRLINEMGKISFDELMIFGMQLTDFNKFDLIKNKIISFREEKEKNKGNYKKFYRDVVNSELMEIYENEISSGKIKTRESKEASLNKFLETKRSNLRDYTDACFRYLRATGIVAISHKGSSLSIMPDKQAEVDFILENIDRKPVFVDDEKSYKEYLFNGEIPLLLTDDREHLIEYILRTSTTTTKRQLESMSLEELKDFRDETIKNNRNSIVSAQVKELKSYSLYSEVVDTYNEILSDSLYDEPLMLEWNTWRAMTMINGGKITGNFKIDDAGQPMSTAVGNVPDIVCDYGDFDVTVEVTMQQGQRQYDSESEPVARHLGKHKEKVKKRHILSFHSA